MTKTNIWLAIMCGMMVNAVLFGVGTITVLTVPALTEHAKYLIPAVVVLSFALSPFISWLIAPRMRLRNWGKEEWQRGDMISG
ncbi:hypothetical protein GAO09_06190 [Rhizobiales bacterium RZME27]|jgi:hypothetical protein|uniref:MFS transporter n=1 Tax=Endobacterium cereale TaxID=2663029 RepID=A0A6A8A7N2_9HYPH|nr:hypothetical protein [Endobacterium cereale]MEB2846213.1 hypothetical protein [Endobacterium cereale]MQY45650.1 hypothetical protein [Endobacterium cereale]